MASGTARERQQNECKEMSAVGTNHRGLVWTLLAPPGMPHSARQSRLPCPRGTASGAPPDPAMAMFWVCHRNHRSWDQASTCACVQRLVRPMPAQALICPCVLRLASTFFFTLVVFFPDEVLCYAATRTAGSATAGLQYCYTARPPHQQDILSLTS